jgi:hypothetical protein
MFVLFKEYKKDRSHQLMTKIKDEDYRMAKPDGLCTDPYYKGSFIE